MEHASYPSASSAEEGQTSRASFLPIPVRPPPAILAGDSHLTLSTGINVLPTTSQFSPFTLTGAGRESLYGAHPQSQSPPPPPYIADSSRRHRPSVTALTFFLVHDEPTAMAGRPTRTAGIADDDVFVADLLPPAYAETPRTQAERLFWFGWLLPPFLWIVGASRIWRTETTCLVGDKEGGVDLGIASDAGADVREAVEQWREEELVWARRCAWALIGSLLLGALLGVMLASVTGQM